jgi:hypothetical protein
MYYGRGTKYTDFLEYVVVGDRSVLELIFKKWFGAVFPKLLYSRTPFGLEK